MATIYDFTSRKPVNGVVPLGMNPLRRMCSQACECGHTWIAPGVGKCPKCSSDQTTIVDERFCDATRV